MDVLAPFFVVNLPWLFGGILVLYFLRLRREEVVLPSTLLWQKVVEDLRVNTPFQRITRNLLLFLQLLVMAILLLAMMRPVVTSQGYEGENIVLVLDTSASMGTVESGNGTRLAQAQEMAHDVVTDLARDDSAMVVAFDGTARTVVSRTRDRARLHAAIDSLRPTGMPTRIGPALRAVAQQQMTGRQPITLVLSDGRFADEVDLTDVVPNLSFVPVGVREENVGITALSAARTRTPSGVVLQAVLRVISTFPTEVRGTATFYLDGAAAGLEELVLPPLSQETLEPGSATVVFDRFPHTDGVMEVVVDVPDDPLPADNRAYTVLTSDNRIRVLLVSEGDVFLENALRSIERVETVTDTPMPPEVYAASHDGPGGVPPDADVVIFDEWVPQRLLAPRAMFVGAVPPLEGWSAGEREIKNPAHLDQDYDHPLTRFVNFGGCRVWRALALEPPRGADVLWEAFGGLPLVVAQETEDRLVVATAFSAVDGDLAFTPTWLIFLANAMDWLSGSKGSSAERKAQVGDTLTLTPPADVFEVVFLTPAGDRTVLPVLAGRGAVYFGDTTEAGVYRALDPDGNLLAIWALNLLDEKEVRIAPAEVLEFSGRTIPASPAPSQVLTNREVWRQAALLGLLLLLGEWWVYTRRVAG